MAAPTRTPTSVADVLAWLAEAPEGTLLPASTLQGWLAPLVATETATASIGPANSSWRERLWTCPPETRLGVPELSEALGRPKSWVYRRTCATAAKARLPHRRLDGELVFLAGEIRAWVAQHEAVVAAPVRWPGSHVLGVLKGAA